LDPIRGSMLKRWRDRVNRLREVSELAICTAINILKLVEKDIVFLSQHLQHFIDAAVAKCQTKNQDSSTGWTTHST